MRRFSSAAHHAPIAAPDDPSMIDDPVLPAAAHLTGPHAIDVVGAAIAATGSTLLDCRPVHVQYRPENDLIVRYSATVRRADGTTARDTLLAGATTAGVHPGTVPVESVTDDGLTITAGVWRWPFDPVLVDLDRVASPHRAARVLRGLVDGQVRVEVVVYRPCERVVVRVTDGSGTVRYVKLVAPDAVAALADRHIRLDAAGLPVPRVLATGDSWIAMSEMPGLTLRDVIKSGTHDPRPSGRELVALTARLAEVDLAHHRPVRRRLDDAVAHAAMLASVHPASRERLAELSALFASESARTPDGGRVTIHGDLHEGQLVVDGGHVTGLIDVDDAGPGARIDDLANLLGHLRFRAIAGSDRSDELTRYAAGIRRELDAHVDGAELDVATAAALTGLATGPFRIQQAGWQGQVDRVLDVAASLAGIDERDLTTASSGFHARSTP